MPVGASSVRGSILFTKRVSGELVVQSNLTGLAANALPQALYLGDISDAYRPSKRFAAVSVQTGMATANLKGYTLAQLDTLRGFWGIGYSPAQPDSLVAYANFGGNVASGRARTYTLYGADSAQAGTVTFSERNGGGVQLSWAMGTLPAATSFFITFHKGSGISVPSTYYNVPVAITAGQAGRYNGVRSPNGTPLRYDELDTLNAHLLLTNDTANVATVQASADVGANALTGSHFTVALASVDLISFPLQAGLIQVRQRASGRALVELTVENTFQFVEHLFNLRQGAAGSVQGPLLLTIATVNGAGGHFKQSFDLSTYANGDPLTYANLSGTSPRYFEIEYELGTAQPMVAGNLP